MQVIGKENIPPSSVNYASVSNHLSFFDIGVLMAELSSMFIMKRAILYFPFYGWMAYIFGSISINRYSLKNLNAVAEKMVAFVRLGGKLHLFPEGTRSRDGNLLPFKKGLLHKLYNENLPVLCCALWNTQRAFPADNYNLIKMKFNIPVYLSVGRLLRPTDFASFVIFFNTCCQEVELPLKTLKSLHGSALPLIISLVPFAVYAGLTFGLVRGRPEAVQRKTKTYLYGSVLLAVCTVAAYQIWYKLPETGDLAYRDWILLLFSLSGTVTQRGSIPPMTLFLFFWGMLLYILRTVRLRKEFDRIGNDLKRMQITPPKNDTDTADSHDQLLLTELTESAPNPATPADKSYISGETKLQSGFMQKTAVHISRLPSSERENFTVYISDEIWAKSKSFYIIPGWINWSIPIFGFLGTVLGISMASEGISKIISSPEGIGKLTTELSTAIYPLGIAFDTTLISLSLSLVLMFTQVTPAKVGRKKPAHHGSLYSAPAKVK
ncbi:hypothetical protein CHS0354_027379 [Potamilus streckersoni]|uniref:1-acylglycerol-3-phosphate O-acyltransferase n=1 Tax=Potamilus streckersoni TaxID=2493646 RepID=A0AAE0SQC5_9BIVA|nr:hypothetical protein CHS0354_027379 [Potamilus streckersoni]